MRFQLIPKSSTLDDLEQLIHIRLQKRCSFWSQLQIFERTYPYYQWHEYRPMTLVSGNIRRMQIFVGVPLSGGVKSEWGCRSCTAIFGDLGGYFFGNFRDKASIIIWRYATPCRSVIDSKMNDLEWVAISCKTQFSTSSFRLKWAQISKIIVRKLINIDPYYQWQNVSQWCWLLAI